ncbi:peptidase S8/S53 domain-containing protein [Thamnocephalis sphaerospora]|uniref:Peptidase S8/S53 domain-containing protein n=1 Tax=Thamnocephalis sphaerospora TaxID=78915 RepID=A0A4P9XQC7_9FUNG|nr:peptidase S8/S53 domain-containing protein [Thamnocephalis sphaerospora]|eukprot:RKP08243.1 peptidase S8/S53 domain-containing protein [Thamnocephalis sphaerospora]
MIGLSASPGSAEALREQQAFLAQAAGAALRGHWSVRTRYRFDNAINAVSVDLLDGNVDQLASLPMVRTVWPLKTYGQPHAVLLPRQEPAANQGDGPNNTSADSNEKSANDFLQLAKTATDGVQGLADKPAGTSTDPTGRGVKVGIIDTGVDYTHPALGGCFGPKCKVFVGHDFVGDQYSGYNAPVPDEDPRDMCNGHGTHVAGIIGGKSAEFAGTAPDALFGAYRVFGCSGEVAVDIVTKALERAYDDGMHIINLSLGISSYWTDTPDALVAQRIFEQGVVIVASGGNDGANTLFSIATPATAPDVIAVASFDMQEYSAYYFTLDDNPDLQFDYSFATGIPRSLNNTSLAIIHGIQPLDPARYGCSPMPEKFSGEVLLLMRGRCPFDIKALNAQDSGASGVIIFDTEPGLVETFTNNPKITIPVVTVNSNSGRALFSHIKELYKLERMPKLVFSTKQCTFKNTNGNQLSASSSWGPSASMDIKPDISAYGGFVRSTYPVNLGSWGTLSGTSMAAPKVTGKAAQLIEMRGALRSPAAARDIRRAILNTAEPVYAPLVRDFQVANKTHSVLRQGAGMIAATRLFKNTVAVDPPKVHWSMPGWQSHTFTLTVRNSATYATTFDVSYKSSNPVVRGTVTFPYVPLPSYANETVSFSKDNFTLGAGESTNVDVHYSPPMDKDERHFNLGSGYVVIVERGRNSNVSYAHVPFLTHYGPLRAVDMLERDITSPFPSLNMLVAEGTSVAVLRFRAKLPSTRALVLVQRAGETNPTKALGVIPNGLVRSLDRSSSDKDDHHQVGWAGNVVKIDESFNRTIGSPTRVPEGAYQLQVLLNRPTNNPTNISSFDTWLSPIINVTAVDMKLNAPPPADSITEAKPLAQLSAILGITASSRSTGSTMAMRVSPGQGRYANA